MFLVGVNCEGSSIHVLLLSEPLSRNGICRDLTSASWWGLIYFTLVYCKPTSKDSRYPTPTPKRHSKCRRCLGCGLLSSLRQSKKAGHCLENRQTHNLIYGVHSAAPKVHPDQPPILSKRTHHHHKVNKTSAESPDPCRGTLGRWLVGPAGSPCHGGRLHAPTDSYAATDEAGMGMGMGMACL